MEKPTDRVRNIVSTVVDNAAVIATVVALVALMASQSPKTTGENERQRAERVVEQCWKAVAEKRTNHSGGLTEAETCRRMERGLKDEYGSK